MTPFLKMCLFLGLVAVLIPPAFGLKCVECGGGGKSCKDYKKGDSSFERDCGIKDNGVKYVCSKVKVKDSEIKGCLPNPNGILKMDCEKKEGGEVCHCDGELCNKSGPLKGPCFGMLGIVLLGGVGGQLLWG